MTASNPSSELYIRTIRLDKCERVSGEVYTETKDTMKIAEIKIRIENKAGTLSAVLQPLADNGLNIKKIRSVPILGGIAFDQSFFIEVYYNNNKDLYAALAAMVKFGGIMLVSTGE